MSQSTLQSSSQTTSTITSIIQEIEENMLKMKYEAQPAEEMVRYHKKWSREER